MAIDCVLDADGCCAAWRLQAHASALFRPGYLASYVLLGTAAVLLWEEVQLLQA
jgi:hypothetical protein